MNPTKPTEVRWFVHSLALRIGHHPDLLRWHRDFAEAEKRAQKHDDPLAALQRRVAELENAVNVLVEELTHDAETES